jgi:DNA-directed RNA polymerase subunit RPC12/RpoP
MVTVLDYQSAISQYRRRFLLAWVACFAPAFVFWGASRYLEVEQSRTGSVAIILMLAAGLALWVISRFLWLKDARLKCQDCGRSLTEYKNLVIASRNCPRCGSQVLLDPNDKA